MKTSPRTSHDTQTTGVALDDLAAREIEVLRLITRGLSNQEISAEMYISINTVKTYIRSAYRKIDVIRRSQAIVWAARHGLLDEE